MDYDVLTRAWVRKVYAQPSGERKLALMRVGHGLTFLDGSVESEGPLIAYCMLTPEESERIPNNFNIESALAEIEEDTNGGKLRTFVLCTASPER